MPKMVPLTGTVVIRDGKRVRPIIGKAFDYTAAELADLESAGAKLRKPNDESEAAAPVAATTTTKAKPAAKPSAEASQAKAKGGEKKATAAKSDEEASKDDDL